MKNVLLVAGALGIGLLPAIAGVQHATLFTVVAIPVLLGMIYFVLHGQDWPARLVQWLFACVAVGRVAAYYWLNPRDGRHASLVDSEVWTFGGLAAISFAYKVWKWMRNQSETSISVNPKST